MGPLLFLSFINDLTKGLISKVKLFTDDTAIFSTVNLQIETQNQLMHDLEKIRNWAIQRKMLFNPDQTKPIKEVVFSKKANNANNLIFSSIMFKLIDVHMKNTLFNS